MSSGRVTVVNEKQKRQQQKKKRGKSPRCAIYLPVTAFASSFDVCLFAWGQTVVMNAGSCNQAVAVV